MFKPMDIDEATAAFPAGLGILIPKYEDIPEVYRENFSTDKHIEKMRKLFNTCFFKGLKNLTLVPNEGISEYKAWRHVRCIMGSFEPKHEHKEAACVYMLSEWFKDATWEDSTKE